MDNPRGVIGKVDLAAELRNGLHCLLAKDDGHIGLFKGANDGGDDEMQILLEARPEDSKGVQNFDEAVLPSRLAEVMVERLEHQRQEIGEVGFELSVEGQGDGLDHVDDDDLQSGIRGGGPEIAYRRHDRREVISNVLLDHRNELSEVLEVVLLQADGASPRDVEESRQHLFVKLSAKTLCWTKSTVDSLEAGR